MEEILLGTHIKNRREMLGISQEELCEGLCSVSNLSRIENNQQIPSYTLAKSLLDRLGMTDDLYAVMLDQKTTTTRTLVKEIRNDTVRHRRASKEEKPHICQQIQKKLAELEELVKPTDRTSQQFLVSQRAVWGKPEGPYSTDKKLEMHLEAIRLTHPKFDIEDFQRGHYSMEETRVIIRIATVYSALEQRERAIDIYRQLLWNLEKKSKNLSGYVGVFCLASQNYSINLGMEKYYVEAIKIAARGKDICIYYGNYQFLPGFLAVQAECHHYLGDDKISRELFLQAYYIYKAYGDTVNCKTVQKNMEEYFGIELPE